MENRKKYSFWFGSTGLIGKYLFLSTWFVFPALVYSFCILYFNVNLFSRGNRTIKYHQPGGFYLLLQWYFMGGLNENAGYTFVLEICTPITVSSTTPVLASKPFVLAGRTLLLASRASVLAGKTFLLACRTLLLASKTFALASRTFLLASGTLLLASKTFLLASGTLLLASKPSVLAGRAFV